MAIKCKRKGNSESTSDVALLCDRVAIVREGRIVTDQTIADFRREATKSITLYFADVDAANRTQPPEFLELLVREPTRWSCELTGPTPRLIEWAAQQSIEDMEISQPDLESLFRAHCHSLGYAE